MIVICDQECSTTWLSDRVTASVSQDVSSIHAYKQ
jgi:hypothetical protein